MPGLHAFQHALDAHARSKCARCRNTVESWNLRLEAGQQKLLPAVPTSLVTTDLDLQKNLAYWQSTVQATSMQKHADRCCSCHSIGMSLRKCLASLTNAVKFGGLQDRCILHVHYVHVAREMQMRRILFVGRHRCARTQDEKCFSFAESRAAAVST